jgi:hypothetical protein
MTAILAAMHFRWRMKCSRCRRMNHLYASTPHVLFVASELGLKTYRSAVSNTIATINEFVSADIGEEKINCFRRYAWRSILYANGGGYSDLVKIMGSFVISITYRRDLNEMFNAIAEATHNRTAHFGSLCISKCVSFSSAPTTMVALLAWVCPKRDELEFWLVGICGVVDANRLVDVYNPEVMNELLIMLASMDSLQNDSKLLVLRSIAEIITFNPITLYAYLRRYG